MASAISAQQTSAKESTEEFHRRMYTMVSLLKTTDTYFFYKIVSRSMGTEVVHGPFAFSLEFPSGFIEKHGKRFDKDVTFGLKDSERTWPIKVTVRSFRKTRPRVFAYGDGGWQTFVEDNDIKVGDVVIFTLISFSKFLVFIARAPVEVHPDDNNDGNMDEGDMDEGDMDEGDNNLLRNTSPGRNAEQAPDLCRVCKCPCFVVTIRAQHSSLAVPGRFWELHGNKLQRTELQLKGPNQVVCIVKAKRTYDAEEEKLSVCLDSGWEAFRVSNKLRVGDVLEFFLVGSSCFTVDLRERIEQ